MNSKNVLLVKAAISIVLAVFMLFFPITFLNWFLKQGVDVAAIEANFPAVASIPDLVNLGFAYFGAMLAGVGLICFFGASATASVLRKNVIISLAIADTIGFVLALIAQFSGKFTGLGWIIVVLWAVLALLLAYFGFLKTED